MLRSVGSAADLVGTDPLFWVDGSATSAVSFVANETANVPRTLR